MAFSSAFAVPEKYRKCCSILPSARCEFPIIRPKLFAAAAGTVLVPFFYFIPRPHAVVAGEGVSWGEEFRPQLCNSRLEYLRLVCSFVRFSVARCVFNCIKDGFRSWTPPSRPCQFPNWTFVINFSGQWSGRCILFVLSALSFGSFLTVQLALVSWSGYLCIAR